MNTTSPSNSAVVCEAELTTMQKEKRRLPLGQQPTVTFQLLRETSALPARHTDAAVTPKQAGSHLPRLPAVIPGKHRPQTGSCSEGSTFVTSPSSHMGHFTPS